MNEEQLRGVTWLWTIIAMGFIAEYVLLAVMVAWQVGGGSSARAKRHAYSGEPVPVWLPTAVYEGWLDARKFSFASSEVLYRSLLRRLLWRVGHLAGRLL